MRPLTLYIMTCDVPEADLPLETIMDSVGDVVETYALLNHRNLAEFAKDCQTDWYMYLFSNEKLDDNLKNVLPLLLESDFDVWVMFEQKKLKNEIKYGLSPRLFKKGIKLQGMVPILDDQMSLEKALDGFVEQN